jgi:hypothetical protein
MESPLPHPDNTPSSARKPTFHPLDNPASPDKKIAACGSSYRIAQKHVQELPQAAIF